MYLDIGVPALIFLAMTVVGMELTAADFRRVARYPRLIVAATIGQFLILPAIGWLLTTHLTLHSATAQGLLLIAVCPSGTTASVYTFLGRGNVALSVTLTAISCLAAVFTIPLALSILGDQHEAAVGLSVPFLVLAGQLWLLLLVPVLAGMGVRRRWPEAARRGRAVLSALVTAVAAFMGLWIIKGAGRFATIGFEIPLAVALLTVLAFVAGWLIALACGAGANERFTVAMVFVIRNAGIATAIAVTVLGRLEFAVFAAAYFLAQTPLLLAAVVLFRWTRGRTPAPASVLEAV